MKKVLVAILIIGTILSSGYLVYDRVANRKGYENKSKFETLTPGISLTEAQKTLGNEYKTESTSDGYKIHYYEAPPIMAEPLRLKVNKENIVEEIWISETVKKIEP